MIAAFPETDESLISDASEAEMNSVMDAIRAVRNLRAEVGAAPGKKVDAVIVTEAVELFQANAVGLQSLARVENLTVTGKGIPDAEKSQYLASHGPGFDVYLPVAGLVDIEKELARIDSELKSIEKDLARSTGKLSNEQFVSKAPPEVIEKERRIAAELEDKKAKLEERKRALSG
jgi:valyl-tRNA synthetase